MAKPFRSWSDVLSELEDSARQAMRLLSDSDQLAHQTSPLSDWVAPDDLGDLPDDLRPRALEVLRELDAVENGLLNRRNEIGRQLVEHQHRSPAASPASGRRFDRSA